MPSRQREKLKLKAEVFKAMGHPIRLAIIEMLGKEEKCVCEIVGHVGTDTSNISKHLSILKSAGILTDRKKGLKVYYNLALPCALDFNRCVGNIILERLEAQRALMAS